MVKKMRAIIVLLVIFTLSASCQKKKYPVDINGLTYRNKLNFNNQIKINGLYYGDMIFSENSIIIIYLFSDGTYCRFSTKNYNNNLNENNPVCYSIDKLRDIPYYWGAFIIEGDTLKVQSVNPHRDAFEKFKIEEKWAKIINDTTIHFFKYISPKGEESTLDELFYFKKCTEKPDSTNVLMK